MNLKDTIIVVIGGGLIKDKATGQWRTTNYTEGDNFGIDGSRLRVEAAGYLYKNNPQTIILASGGKGQLKSIPGVSTVAQTVKNELVQLGVPERKIIKEDRSGNSYQQLLKLAKLVQQNNWRHLALLSNKYHLPRIKAMLQYAPHLPELFKPFRLDFFSAEELCLKYDKNKWQNTINQAYRSPVMQKRIKLEQKGIRDIKEGKYKFK